MSFIRRAGAEFLSLISSLLDPAAAATRVTVYVKTVAGVTQLFARTSDGTIYQLTPPGFMTGGEITPAALGAGTTNNYAPAGLANATIVRQAVSAAAALSGLTDGSGSRRVTILNISATATLTNQLTLLNENAGSVAANRFSLPSGLDWIIPPGGAFNLYYDSTTARWRLAGMSSNVFPAGSLAVPGLTLGTTPTRGWNGAAAVINAVNAGVAVTAQGTGFSVTGNLVQTGGTTNLTGGFTNNSAQVQVQHLLWTGSIQPGAISGNNNDYTPASVGTALTVLQDLTAAAVITGFNASANLNGRVLVFVNISTVAARTLTFNHEDAASIAANRIICPGQVPLVLQPGDAAMWRYDGAAARWRYQG